MDPAPPFRTLLGPAPLSIVTYALLGYLLVGSLVELIDLPAGLIWSQAFLFIGPVLVGLRTWGYRPLAFMRADRLPRHPLLVLGASASAFLCASAMLGLIQSLVPETWVKAFDISETLSEQGTTLLYVGVIVGAPLAEELVFRGTLLPMLAERVSRRRAILAQAAIFSLIHIDPIGFVPRVVLGVAFGLLWLDSGSLWAGVFAHALNNGLSSVALLLSGAGETATGVAAQLELAALTLGAGVALGLFLDLLRKRAVELPLPSNDPAALALPAVGNPFGTPELRRWSARYGLAATGGLLVVMAAAKLHH